MSGVDNTLGNILIKHNDKWRGDYYLKDDLTFTVNRSQAARFYLLKSGDTTILNGDRITINAGSRTIIIHNTSEVKLIDRDQSHHAVNSFIITNGTENTDPITYETAVFLISDKNQKKALKYEWGMDLIGVPENNILPGASNYKPHDHPNLINGDYGSTCESYIGTFQFLLERADGPITNLETARNTLATSKVNNSTKMASELLEGYKGIIMVILLMIVLVLCILASR
jgi:hypothetical protein